MRKSMRAVNIVPMLAISMGLVLAGSAIAEKSGALLDKYPAGRAYKGRPAAVDLGSHKDAKTFRTRLRAASKKRPNFAGHMIVTSWGCGTACQVIALIDARSGKVSFGPTASAGIRHRIASRLLIVNPPESIAEAYGGTPPSWLKTKYYLWKDGRLAELKHP